LPDVGPVKPAKLGKLLLADIESVPMSPDAVTE